MKYNVDRKNRRIGRHSVERVGTIISRVSADGIIKIVVYNISAIDASYMRNWRKKLFRKQTRFTFPSDRVSVLCDVWVLWEYAQYTREIFRKYLQSTA